MTVTVPSRAQVTCYRLPVIPPDHRLARFATDPSSHVWIRWRGGENWSIHRHGPNDRYVWAHRWHGWVLDRQPGEDGYADVRSFLVVALIRVDDAAAEVREWLEARNPE